MEIMIKIADLRFLFPVTDQELIDQCRHYRVLPEETESDLSEVIRVCPTIRDGEKESTAVLRCVAEELPSRGMFLMHGAVVAMDGFAYMFTGRSGIGKSTRAALWLEEFPGSYILNGDKPFICVTEGNVLACGTPWAGKEKQERNESLPLRAIFVVERDEDGEGTLVDPVSFGNAFFQLYSSQIHISEDSEIGRETVSLLGKMLEQVPVYRFRGKQEREAVRQAYEKVCRDLRE